MDKIIIAGIDTDVGKTVVSAIMMQKLRANYWKPVQCGLKNPDIKEITRLTCQKHQIFPSSYTFTAPLSPHHAARLENISIDPRKIHLPSTKKNLVIEMAGGVFTPLSSNLTMLDHFQTFGAKFLIVSKHYLGSINHTLLTIEALKARNLPILGIVFNGGVNSDTETAILKISKIPLYGRLFQEKEITPLTIKKYVNLWKD